MRSSASSLRGRAQRTVASVAARGDTIAAAAGEIPLGVKFRKKLLAAVDLSSRVAEDGTLGHVELTKICNIHKGQDASDMQRSLDFLQVMADHGLLADGSHVSFGTPVHRSIANLFLERAAHLVRPGSLMTDRQGRYFEGPKGSGKSTMLRAMTFVIPELVPAVKAVYVDASYYDDDGVAGRLPSLGNAVWARLRTDPSISEVLDKEHIAELDALLVGGGRISLKSRVMPLLQAKGLKLIVAVDEIEAYFASHAPGASWQADLTFFGDLNQLPCIGILTDSSSILSDLMHARDFLKPFYPKLERDLNTTKIRKLQLEVLDPFSIRVAQYTLLHSWPGGAGVAAKHLPGPFAAALLMIGGGSNPRQLLGIMEDFIAESSGISSPEAGTEADISVNRASVFVSASTLSAVGVQASHAYDKDLIKDFMGSPLARKLAEIVAKPFDVVEKSFPLGHETLAEVPRHLYHAMYKKNMKLWKDSGVAQALEDMDVDAAERLSNAVLALAAFIHEHGDGWREHFCDMSEAEIAASYEEFWQFADGIKVVANPTTGLDLLVKHRYLLAGISGANLKRYAAPSLAHILSSSQPHPKLVTDENVRMFKTSENTEAESLKEMRSNEEQQRDRAAEQRAQEASRREKYALVISVVSMTVAAIAMVPTVFGWEWLSDGYDSVQERLATGASSGTDSTQAYPDKDCSEQALASDSTRQ